LGTLEVFVVLSFHWLNLAGFYVYAIPQKKPSPSCKGFITAVSETFGKFETFQKLNNLPKQRGLLRFAIVVI